MAKINITIETASNGVYFTHNGETLVFTDPTLLGDHLFDLALDAQDEKPMVEKKYNLYIKGVDLTHAIPQIKAIRAATGMSLKEAKDAHDVARKTGAEVCIGVGVSLSVAERAKSEFHSFTAIRQVHDSLVVLVA